MIRRLDPIQDRNHFVDAHLWVVNSPRWFKESDRVFGPPTFEDFIESAKEESRATFGVFDGELIALVMFILRAKGRMEVDFMARPRCNAGTVVTHCLALRDRAFEDLGTQELFVWVAKKNLPTRRLCGTLGFREDGLRLIKGMYRGRVIEWRRMNMTRDIVAALKAA